MTDRAEGLSEHLLFTDGVETATARGVDLEVVCTGGFCSSAIRIVDIYSPTFQTKAGRDLTQGLFGGTNKRCAVRARQLITVDDQGAFGLVAS